MRPGLEGTGPAIDLGMAMGALNTGAASWMWDWEDAGGDYKDQLYQAWENLRDLLAHQVGRQAVRASLEESRAASRASTRSIFRRRNGRRFSIACRGCTCRTGRSRSTENRCPAIIPALLMHAVNNYDTQKKNGSGVYYYVPKIETWQEARLVSSLLKKVEEALGLPRGTLKIKMLNERAEYALQQEAIMWVLRENLIGPNVGRWDYLNSREEMFRHDPAMVIPDPNTVTMTEPSLSYYTMRNALLALLAGGMPIGGMAAQMQNPQAPGERSEGAARHLVRQAARAADRASSRSTGRSTTPTGRAGWPPSRRPTSRPAAKPLVTDVDDLQTVVDKLKPEEKKRLEDLGLLKDGKIAPLELSEADLTPEKLFSEDARTAAAVAAAGPDDRRRIALRDVHVDGVHVPAAARQQRRGDFRSAHRSAVHERSRDLRDLLALPVSHGVPRRRADRRWEVLEGGRSRHARAVRETARRAARDGEGAVQEARHGLREDERRARAVAAEAAGRRRAAPDGRLVPQPRWIKYGSRVLLSIIEESDADRTAILDGIFTATAASSSSR